MADNIVLSKGIRNNLLNLQKTAQTSEKIQSRLATGKKVNSALDNPSNYFTASSLSARANDMSNLLDGLSNGIQVLKAADNGLTSITSTIESMQSTVRQARQDKTWNSETFTVDAAETNATTGVNTTLTFDGGAFGTTQGTITLTKGTGSGTDGALTVDDIVAAINGDSTLSGKVKASNDDGELRIKNLSTEDLTIGGSNTLDTGTANQASTTVDGNSIRADLVTQFNELRDQLDKLSDDSSFNGVNLLQGDLLTLTFNETGTSTLDIQRTDSSGSGTAINAVNLGIDEATNSEFQSDSSLDDRLQELTGALNTIRSQASTFGSNLSMVQNRQDFSNAMINTLTVGSDNLTLADQNGEAANLLALQTRQQLSQTALSLANQADQGVLRLF